MNSLKCVALSLLAWGMVMPNARAGVISLDQSNLPGLNGYSPLGPTFVPGESTAEMAQVFTPGVTGQITSISVDLLTFNYVPFTPISLQLLSVTGGIPDISAPLSAVVTDYIAAGTGFSSFDLSPLNINLTAGVPVAYWLTADPANGFSRWIGDFSQSYSGGQTFFRFPGATDGSPTTFSDPHSLIHDSAYFQTFMETPEPSTAAIVGLGLLALGLRRRGAKQLSN